MELTVTPFWIIHWCVVFLCFMEISGVVKCEKVVNHNHRKSLHQSLHNPKRLVLHRFPRDTHNQLNRTKKDVNEISNDLSNHAKEYRPDLLKLTPEEQKQIAKNLSQIRLFVDNTTDPEETYNTVSPPVTTETPNVDPTVVLILLGGKNSTTIRDLDSKFAKHILNSFNSTDVYDPTKNELYKVFKISNNLNFNSVGNLVSEFDNTVNYPTKRATVEKFGEYLANTSQIDVKSMANDLNINIKFHIPNYDSVAPNWVPEDRKTNEFNFSKEMGDLGQMVQDLDQTAAETQHDRDEYLGQQFQTTQATLLNENLYDLPTIESEVQEMYGGYPEVRPESLPDMEMWRDQRYPNVRRLEEPRLLNRYIPNYYDAGTAGEGADISTRKFNNFYFPNQPVTSSYQTPNWNIPTPKIPSSYNWDYKPVSNNNPISSNWNSAPSYDFKPSGACKKSRYPILEQFFNKQTNFEQDKPIMDSIINNTPVNDPALWKFDITKYQGLSPSENPMLFNVSTKYRVYSLPKLFAMDENRPRSFDTQNYPQPHQTLSKPGYSLPKLFAMDKNAPQSFDTQNYPQPHPTLSKPGYSLPKLFTMDENIPRSFDTQNYPQPHPTLSRPGYNPLLNIPSYPLYSKQQQFVPSNPGYISQGTPYTAARTKYQPSWPVYNYQQPIPSFNTLNKNNPFVQFPNLTPQSGNYQRVSINQSQDPIAQTQVKPFQFDNSNFQYRNSPVTPVQTKSIQNPVQPNDSHPQIEINLHHTETPEAPVQEEEIQARMFGGSSRRANGKLTSADVSEEERKLFKMDTEKAKLKALWKTQGPKTNLQELWKTNQETLPRPTPTPIKLEPSMPYRRHFLQKQPYHQPLFWPKFEKPESRRSINGYDYSYPEERRYLPGDFYDDGFLKDTDLIKGDERNEGEFNPSPYFYTAVKNSPNRPRSFKITESSEKTPYKDYDFLV